MHWPEMSLHKFTGQVNPLMATFETSVFFCFQTLCSRSCQD